MNQERRAVVAFFMFLLPWLIGFLTFQVGPMIASAVLVFYKYDILSPPTWVGLSNVRQMFGGDKLFGQSLRITAEYTVIVVPLGILIGYAMALLLNRGIVGLSFWRTAYYLPSVVPTVATAFLWSWIFNRDFGPLNGALSLLGIQGPNWLGSEDWVIPAFIVMALWGAGGGLIIYLAALQQVPTSLYDAAKVDGANAFQRLRHVTLPMTSFVIFFTFVTGLIGTFQVFGSGFVLTAGGPNNASLFYVLYLYQVGWQFLHMGYASALAWFLFLVILALTVLVIRGSRNLVYYEGEDKGA
jgi:multiple sugar transport system permease protein